MRKLLIFFSAALLLAACSSPKYTYHFDHYDYNSGKKKVMPQAMSMQTQPVDEKTVVASTDESTIYLAREKPVQVISKKEVADKIKIISKEERKELKKEIKKYVKENRKGESVNSTTSTTKLAGDLKLAALFGVVGIVLMIVLGDLLWLGSIAVLIGLFFLVRYLINN